MRKFMLILLLFFSLISFSQSDNEKKIDSLIGVLSFQKDNIHKCEILNDLSNRFYTINPEEGIKYAEKGLQLSLKLNYKKGIGQSNLYKGKNLFAKGEYKKALFFYSKAKKIFIEINDNHSLGSVLLNIGNVSGSLSNFPEALSSYFQAIIVLEKGNDKTPNLTKADCYQNIANIYNANDNYSKAIENYNLAIDIYSKFPQEQVSMAMNMASKGIIYEKQKKNSEAIAIYKLAEKKLIKLNEQVPLAYVNSWMGIAYSGLKEYDLSINNSTKALTIITKIGDKDLTASTLLNIGFCYLQKAEKYNTLNDLNLGFKNTKEALDINLEANNHEGISKDYFQLSDYYNLKKDYKLALESYIKGTVYKDSIFNADNKETIKNLEDKRTIELRDKEIKINKLTFETKEKQKWLLISALAFLGIIGGLLFYQSRNRQKVNEKLQLLNAELHQANKTKTRFFSILNHDLRSPVSNLIHYLHLQKENPELLDPESKLRMENKTITGAENLLSSMEDILLWSKGQMENFEPKAKRIPVSSLFENTQNHFSGEEKIQIRFENFDNISIHTDENYVKTIMRNLTGNAIKALAKIENPIIVWKAWKENGHHYLSISDNGPGSSEEKFKALYDEKEVVSIKTGLGLHLIRDLAKAIHCEISVYSKVNEGTTFALKF